MSGTVYVDNPTLPDGYEFEIPGLGLVKNRVEREVDDSQVGAFVAAGNDWPDNNKLVLDQAGKEPPKEEKPAKARSTKKETS
jgi:hypothetical protein